MTIATILTGMRAVGAGILFAVAITKHSHSLLLIALSVSMFFDFIDGFVARSRGGETVFGAQLDGLADRLAAALVIAGVCSMRGDVATWVAASIVWVQFGLLDQLLASQFLRFGLWSPDHFYVINENVWRLNWSPLAKLGSNLPVGLLALSSETSWVASALAAILIVIRLRSYPGVRAEAAQRLDESYLAASAEVVRQESEARPTEGVQRLPKRRRSHRLWNVKRGIVLPGHRRHAKDDAERPVPR